MKIMFSSTTGKSYLAPFILVTNLFMLWGIVHRFLDILNKHFQIAFTLTKVQSGLVQFSTYIVYRLGRRANNGYWFYRSTTMFCVYF